MNHYSWTSAYVAAIEEHDRVELQKRIGPGEVGGPLNPLKADAQTLQAGRQLYAATQKVAPSLVRYTEPTAYDRETGEALRAQAAGIFLRKRYLNEKRRSRQW